MTPISNVNEIVNVLMEKADFVLDDTGVLLSASNI